MTEKDRLFAGNRPELVNFQFDEAVVQVFPDMIRRSVPGYESIVTLIGGMAADYYQPGTAVYDLGCSLGACLLCISRQVQDKECRFIGVDNSASMVARCNEVLSQHIPTSQLEVRQQDIKDTPISDASVVVMNFTLQFVNQSDRLDLVSRIYQGMRPGGVFLVSEKICYKDQQEESFHQARHLDFKRGNGYSELEISQKRAALEKVLVAESEQAHIGRLKQAGFGTVYRWFQAFNFASFAAIR